MSKQKLAAKCSEANIVHDNFSQKEDMDEVNNVLASNYATPDNINKADLEAELDKSEDDIEAETPTPAVASNVYSPWWKSHKRIGCGGLVLIVVVVAGVVVAFATQTNSGGGSDVTINTTPVPIMTPTMYPTQNFLCESMDDLEAYMTSKYVDLINPDETSKYDCNCSETEKEIVIYCELNFLYDGKTATNFEQITFEEVDTTYELTRTIWGDTTLNSTLEDPEEVYNFVGGELSSCMINGCESCSICPDRISVSVHCEAQPSYTACNHNYTGSFSNTYYFSGEKEANSTPSLA